MRNENRHKIPAKRAKRVNRKSAVIFGSASYKKKDSQTKERSPEIFPKTRLLRSFQTAQMKACRQ